MLKPVEDARLEDLLSGASIPLGMLPVPSMASWVIDIRHTVEPLGTFDNVLLVRAFTMGDYGGGGNWPRDTDFTALDLDTGQPFPLWTQAEANRYVAQAARGDRKELERLQTMRSLSLNDEPPELTICAPFYDDTHRLRVRLQLTFEVCGADTDESWSDYCASTTVESDVLPATLEPVATAPDVLRAYWDHHPMDERCGWSRVPAPGPARERLEALVREHQLPHHQRLGSSPRA